jgi:hypothetical protein
VGIQYSIMQSNSFDLFTGCFPSLSAVLTTSVRIYSTASSLSMLNITTTMYLLRPRMTQFVSLIAQLSERGSVLDRGHTTFLLILSSIENGLNFQKTSGVFPKINLLPGFQRSSFFGFHYCHRLFLSLEGSCRCRCVNLWESFD